MTRISLLETAHDIVRRHLTPNAFAVDATLGNGHDTAFLAQCVGEGGRVFGFDVQAQALANTGQRLLQQGLENRAVLFHASHAEMLAHIPEELQGRIRAVMFNLGYLPGAEKTLITQTGSTLAALDAACGLLAEQGVITVLAYPGHAGGDSETLALTDWCGQLPRQFQVEIVLSKLDKPTAPRLFVIRKQADLL
jgi:hypothetical protein